MSRSVLSVASLLIALPSAANGFVFPAFVPPPYYASGMSHRVQLDRVEIRPVLSRPGHRRFGTSWRRPMPSIAPLYSSADDQSPADGGGSAGSDAIDQEIAKIKTTSMTAGQIKSELDSRGVSYAGLLEKAEYVRALAEARVGGPSSSTSVDSTADSGSSNSDSSLEDGDEASRASQADGVGAADKATAAPAAAVCSPSTADTQPEVVPAPEKEPRSSASAVVGDVPIEPAVQEEELGAAYDSEDGAPGKGKTGGFSATAATSDSGTSEEHGRDRTPGDEPNSPPEDESVSIPGDARVREQAPVREEEPALKVPARKEESGQAKPVDADEPVVTNPTDVAQKRATTTPEEAVSKTVGSQTTIPSTSTPKGDRQDAASATTTAAAKEPAGDGGAVAQEVAKIREARMTAGQIKNELDSLNVSYAGLLEKSEFVQRLAEARTYPEKSTGADSGVPEATPTTTRPGVAAVDGEHEGVVSDPAAVSGGSEVTVGEGDDGNSSVDEEPTVVKVKVEKESPPRADDEPVSVEVKKERAPSAAAPGAAQAEDIHEKEVPAAGGATAEGTGGNGDSAARGGGREEVSGMRMSAIKKELDELGVNYAGLLEKSEFVDLLVDARVRGDTASTTRSSGSGSDTSSGGGGGGGSGTTNSDFDPSYKNVEVKKMKKDNSPKQEQQQQPGAGGGMAGGFDINSILSGLGGTGGAAGAGVESAAGGFDINGILNNVGGMGGAEGGGAPDAGGGMGGVGDMLNKLMNNPSAMEAFQRAQSNPKVMAAIRDVQQNGLSAMAKYSQDPEIMAVIDDLKSLF